MPKIPIASKLLRFVIESLGEIRRSEPNACFFWADGTLKDIGEYLRAVAISTLKAKGRGCLAFVPKF